MGLITKDDFGSAIKNRVLDQITEFDDSKLATAIQIAETEVKGYLNTRFVVAEIFAQTDDARDAKVVSCCVDIALFHLHKTLNPQKTPKHREASYENAINWLESVQAGRIDPPELPRPIDPEKNHIKWSSNPRKDNRI
jgi:phage gp36-like protein